MVEPEAKPHRISSLAARLRERIKREGPIGFRDWMEAALYDPREGYYCRADLKRWGRAGDYRTAPERSPLFAATFVRYFAGLYEELGAPRDWAIIEAGAGAGHFARGVLQTLQRDYPNVFSATRYIIDEASDDARQRIRRLLNQFEGHVEFRRLAELEDEQRTGIIFANELLDALPAHRVLMRKGQLAEMCVGTSDNGSFIWVELEPTTPRLIEHFESAGVQLSEGQLAEVCLDAEDWYTRAAASINRGYLITVDYGAEETELYTAPHRRQGTLRAFHQHQFVDDVLAQPGGYDFTTTVNWTNLKRGGASLGLQSALLLEQDKFLLQAGLLDELEREMARAVNESERLRMSTSAREMILPGGMSSSFQVLVMKKATSMAC